MTLKIDQRLQQGRYRIRSRLGQGGMGTVYLAEDHNLSDRTVAIKENTDASAEAQTQFQREAVLLADLTHPNLPRVTDHFIEPSGRQYLVMDYVQGPDLRELLHDNGGPFTEDEALPWIAQVMSALEYMHNWVDPITHKPSPIIHRDIKPGNLKRTPSGRVVLVDFGLAKFAEGSVTILGARAVTPGYSPVEQYTGGTGVRSDIYALGATLYALLTGKRPPEAPAIAAGATLPSPRRINPTISRSTEQVILRAMQIQPAGRYASVQEMRDALFNQKSTKRLTARLWRSVTRGLGQTTPASATRQRWAGSSLGLGTLLLILLLAIGVGLAQMGSARLGWLLNFDGTPTPVATTMLAVVSTVSAKQNKSSGEAASGTPAAEQTAPIPLPTRTVRPPLTREAVRPTVVATATVTGAATPTATHVIKPTATVGSNFAATSTRVIAAQTKTVATQTPGPPSVAKNTVAATSTIIATMTATRRPPTPTAPAKPTATPGNLTVTLIQPSATTLRGLVTFSWIATIVPGENQAFEMVLWEEGQEPLSDGFSPPGASRATTVSADLGKFASTEQGSRLLIHGRRYRWGVLLVEMQPAFRRLRYLGGSQPFRFETTSSSNNDDQHKNSPLPTPIPRG